jgi:hypothetical protein
VWWRTRGRGSEGVKSEEIGVRRWGREGKSRPTS